MSSYKMNRRLLAVIAATVLLFGFASHIEGNFVYATSKQTSEYQKGAERSKTIEEVQKAVENLSKEHQKATEKNQMEIEKAKQEKQNP